MIDEGNIFSTPATQLQLSEARHDNLQEIYLNAKAINFYLISTLRKCLKEMAPKQQQRRAVMQCYFNRFQEGIYNQKKQKVINLFKVTALKTIGKYRRNKINERQKCKAIQQKMRIYRNRSIVKEWRNVVATEHAYRQLEVIRKKDSFIEFLTFLRENQQSNIYKALQLNKQIESLKNIYSKKLLKRSFQSIVIHKKMSQISRYLMNKYLLQFKKHAAILNCQEKSKTAAFYKRLLLQKCFMAWKISFHEIVAEQYHSRNLIFRYFQHWKSNLDVIASERQIEKNNQCIADIFLERLTNKKMKKVLQSWKQWLIELQQTRQTNLIINAYAEKKRRQMLLSRYFQILRQNCINNKIKVKYYAVKLKRKTIDSMKIYFRESVYRQEKIIDFMEKRLLKKCFRKLRVYNLNEHQKISRFKLSKFFKVFTQNIIANYCIKNQLSTSFYRTNLLFKVLFGLKKQKAFRQKESYIIGLVNVILPLRRWLKMFRIRKFKQDRFWFQKKGIFREWKLMIIRKNSEEIAIRQFRETSVKKNVMNASQSKMEEQFEFSNILSTIAKIRNNLQAERQQTLHQKSRVKKHVENTQFSAQTPSQSIDYSLSLDYP